MRRADLTTFIRRLSSNPLASTSLEPSGSVQACNGIHLHFTSFIYSFILLVLVYFVPNLSRQSRQYTILCSWSSGIHSSAPSPANTVSRDALLRKNEEQRLTFAKSLFCAFQKYHHTAFIARISRRNNAL